MFRLFGRKRKPVNVMDSLIKATYGDHPPKETADILQATGLAADYLLGGAFDKQAIKTITADLHAGPIPYSTHDLAVAVALNRFKSVQPEKRHLLFEVQLVARMTVASWVKEGKVVRPLAQALEEYLYEAYKPSAADDDPESASDSVDEEDPNELIEKLAEVLAHNATTFPPSEVLRTYLAGAGYGHIPEIRLRFGISIANEVLNVWALNTLYPDSHRLRQLVESERRAFLARQPQTDVTVGSFIVDSRELRQVRNYLSAATNQDISDLHTFSTSWRLLAQSVLSVRRIMYQTSLERAAELASRSELPDGCGPTTYMALELATGVTGETIDSGGESFVGFAAGLEAFLDNYAMRLRDTLPASG